MEFLDDYVSAADPARFINAVVDRLDVVAAGFAHAEPKEIGHPGHLPADVLMRFL
jgi:hypothetical protein